MAFTIAPPKMSQATIVVGLMLAAFILWLAANNRLVTYWNILIGRGGGSSGAGSGAGSGQPAPASGNPVPSMIFPGQTTTILPPGSAPAAIQFPGMGGP